MASKITRQRTTTESNIPARGIVGGAAMGATACVLCIIGGICTGGMLPLFVVAAGIAGFVGGTRQAKDKGEEIPSPSTDTIRKMAANAKEEGKSCFRITQEKIDYESGKIFGRSSVKRIDEFRIG